MSEPLPNTTGRRESHRVVLEPTYTIRFTLRGQLFDAVPLANISAGGCFATVSHARGAAIQQDDLLEGIAFDHPDLPQVPLKGRVAFALRSEDPEGQFEYTGIGVAFLDLPSEAKNLLERFVAKRLELD